MILNMCDELEVSQFFKCFDCFRIQSIRTSFTEGSTNMRDCLRCVGRRRYLHYCIEHNTAVSGMVLIN